MREFVIHAETQSEAEEELDVFGKQTSDNHMTSNTENSDQSEDGIAPLRLAMTAVRTP